MRMTSLSQKLRLREKEIIFSLFKTLTFREIAGAHAVAYSYDSTRHDNHCFDLEIERYHIMAFIYYSTTH